MGDQRCLPSIPHGNWLNTGTDKEQFLGAFFSNVPVKSGDSFTRPSAGGGGIGDPSKRNPNKVLEDVVDGYVSIERAKKDYGVVITPIESERDLYEIDQEETEKARAYIRKYRKQWLDESIESVYKKYKAQKIDKLDLLRRYGVILDYETDKILEKSTKQYREYVSTFSR